MTCGECGNKGSKTVRCLDPEVLGIENPQLDEDGDSLPIFIVQYSCNFWDNQRHTGAKTSIGIGVKSNTPACTHFMEKVDIVPSLKTDWLESMTASRNLKIQERLRCFSEVTH